MLESARAPTSTLRDQLSAAEILVAFGRSDDADAAIATVVSRMRSGTVAGGPATTRLIERLSIVSKQFRSAKISHRIQAMGSFADRLIDTDDEAVLHVAKGARTLLVVFGTMFNDFWVSYPVLHCLLPHDVSILYLKDPRELLYLGGLATYGEGFQALCAGVRGVADQLGITDIRVTGYSSGGYGGLMFAGAIGARAYLGFSIRTDLNPDTNLRLDRYSRRAELRQAVGPMLRDLKPLLAEQRGPELGVLYYGDGTEIDAGHARHLEDLPNFIVKRLPATRHNTIISLLADGQFERTMRRFVH